VNVRKFGSNNAAKIVSTVFAVLLWFHVTSNTTFSSKWSLPIRYIGPSEGYVLASDKPVEAMVVLSGTGRDLVRFYLSGFGRSDERYALVNLTGLPEGSNTVAIDKNMVHLGSFSDITVETIVSPTNASFTVEVDRLIKRTVAVDTKSLPEYKLADNYVVIGKPRAKPAFVVMKGPSEIVGTYNVLQVTSFDKKNLSPADSIIKGYLKTPRFVDVEPDEVDLYFAFEQVVTRRISGINAQLIDFPRKNRPAFKPDSLTVILKGPKSIVQRIKPDQVTVTVTHDMYLDAVGKKDTSIAPVVRLAGSISGVAITGIEPKVLSFGKK